MTMLIYRRTYARGGREREARFWSCAFSIGGKRFRQSTGLTDRHAATVRAGQMYREAQERAAGIRTHARTRALPPLALAEEFALELARRRRAPAHVQATRLRLRALLEGATTLSQVTAESVRSRLLVLGERGDWTPSTQNRYRAALSSFFAWLAKEGRWGENPVRQVSPAAVHEPSIRRRAATDEEMRRLLLAAPPYRSIVYNLAASAGLRRSELAALLWSDVDLEGGTVLVRAGSAKNRKEVALPLHRGCRQALLQWRSLVAGPKLFPRGVPSVRTLRQDLAAASVEYATDAGILDFHALRSTFATSLARAGVPLAMAQRLCRHSTPVLTARFYTRLELSDLEGAVAKLGYPAPLSRAGGVWPEVCQTGEESKGKERTYGDARPAAESAHGKEQTPAEGPVSGVPRGSMHGAPRRTRTFDPLIKSQLDRRRGAMPDNGLRAPEKGVVSGTVSGPSRPAPEELVRQADALLATASSAPYPEPLRAAARALLAEAASAAARKEKTA